jgi:DNA-binding HxlR family transcriptional regulator
VLWTLGHKRKLRFTELQAQLPRITPKVLTERLRRLERDGLIARTYHPEMPPRVEYEVTELGRTLRPVFRALERWGDRYLDDIAAAQRRYDRQR